MFPQVAVGINRFALTGSGDGVAQVAAFGVERPLVRQAVPVQIFQKPAVDAFHLPQHPVFVLVQEAARAPVFHLALREHDLRRGQEGEVGERNSFRQGGCRTAFRSTTLTSALGRTGYCRYQGLEGRVRPVAVPGRPVSPDQFAHPNWQVAAVVYCKSANACSYSARIESPPSLRQSRTPESQSESGLRP